MTQYDETFTPVPRSYLQFTGCTNFSSKIAVAIPSVSCSSDATGRGSGMAGLIYSAALNARAAGTITDAPRADCERVDGSACIITADEVHQLMAAGELPDGPIPDDVDFSTATLTCSPLPAPGCTDPTLNTLMGLNGVVVSPVATTRRYPAKKGHDQFYGYGRANLNRSVDALTAGRIPPAVEIQSPDWSDLVDASKPNAEIRAEITSRSATGYRCRVLVAPGSYPDNREGTERRLPGRPVAVVRRHDAAYDALRRRDRLAGHRGAQGALPGQRRHLRRSRAGHRRADLVGSPQHRALRLRRQGRGDRDRRGRGADRPGPPAAVAAP